MKLFTKYTLSTIIIILCFSVLINAQNAFDLKKPKGKANSKTTAKLINQPVKKLKKTKSSFAKNNSGKLSTFEAQNFKPVNLKLARAKQNLKIAYNENEVPYFIVNTVESAKKAGLNTTALKQGAAQKFLTEKKEILKINDTEKELKLLNTTIDKNGFEHFKYKQLYKNIPVWASELVVHVNHDKVYCLNGRYHPTPITENDKPQISSEVALKKVIDDLDLSGIACSGKTSPLLEKLVPHCKPGSKLMWLPTNNGNFKLVWQVQYAPAVNQHWNYFVNAIDGAIEKKYQDVCSFGPETANATDLYGTSRTINTYSHNNRYYLIDASRPNYSESRSTLPDDPVGAIVTLDLKNNQVDQSGTWIDLLAHVESSNNNWNSRTSVSAHYNAGRSYEYFKNTFGRNSIDGKGGTVWSVINVGKDFDNAFWNGSAMFYGNGGDAFKDLPKAIDAAAHEMSHGVIQNTANLIYEFQPGALNESFADVFGAMVDRDDWQIGEAVVQRSVFPSGAMRDMQNPNNGAGRLQTGWQPANMSQYVNLRRNEDNGGVHINSGIPNKAFQLFATSVGKNTAEQVYYHALTNYLTQQSQFTDCRASVIQSSMDLYDNSVATAAAKAFDDVGIKGDGVVGGTSGGSSTTGTELPTSRGTDFFLLVDRAAECDGCAVDFNIDNSQQRLVSNLQSFPKVSITDNGSTAYYVDTLSGVLHQVDLLSSNPFASSKKICTDTGYKWRKVTVSRDGSLLALLDNEEDNSLWIIKTDAIKNNNDDCYDLSFGQDYGVYWLYNLSTLDDDPNTEDIDESKAGEPEYADAIEFAPNGAQLMYDAYNILRITSEKDTIGFWDVGIINFWNNTTNNFMDAEEAKVVKIFPPQPSNISIGNATYAKNDGNIIAFDMLDVDQGSNGELYVMAANLSTGEANLIHKTNNEIGYPTFSPDDDAIAYSDYEENQYTVGRILLNSDKISPKGSANRIFSDAAWPVWYRRGERDWVKPEANFAANVTEGPASLTVNFNDRSSNLPNKWQWAFEGGDPATSNEQNVIVTFENPGLYRVSLTASNPAGNDTETKDNYIMVGNPLSIIDPAIVNAVDLSNQPNPFAEQTLINFNMLTSGNATLDILDISGKRLQTLIDKRIAVGIQKVNFDARGYSPGIYFMRLTTGDFSFAEKIVIR